MKLGYFYFHYNLPVISTERRPEPAGFEDDPYLFYLEQVQEWARQLIVAENRHENGAIDIPGGWWTPITPGQAIEYEGNVIHKIIQT